MFVTEEILCIIECRQTVVHYCTHLCCRRTILHIKAVIRSRELGQAPILLFLTLRQALCLCLIICFFWDVSFFVHMTAIFSDIIFLVKLLKTMLNPAEAPKMCQISSSSSIPVGCLKIVILPWDTLYVYLKLVQRPKKYILIQVSMGGEKTKVWQKERHQGYSYCKSNVLTCWKKFAIKFWPRDSRLK